MQKALQEKTPLRTYRHFSVPPPGFTTTQKKLEFFYIGKTPGSIDILINAFESGYAADNIEEAHRMLKKHHDNAGSLVIIAEAGLGYKPLMLFAQFLSSQKNLSAVPFILEGTGLTDTELDEFRNEPFADDIVSLIELGTQRLLSKIKFWKRIKERMDKKTELYADISSFAHPSPLNAGKRAFDILISLFLMVVLSPLFLLIMIALRIESKGPVFYVSRRTGRGYRIFNFYKFRTMEAQANEKISDFSHLNIYNPLKANGPVFIKIDNDPRITRLGNFLRKCSLDELPQLLNVFKGDMSLVGNRPLPLYEAVTLTTDEWAKRFMAPAGITGLWQIKKKRQTTITAEERIRLDINYADNSSFLFDLWIMLNTPSAVIQRTNA